MRAAFTTLAALLLIATTPARDDDDDDRHDPARVAEHLERALASTPQTFQFTNLRNITTGPNVGAAGGAFLIRSKNGLTARVMAADLEPGHAFTFWWIIFNKPNRCAQTPRVRRFDERQRSGALRLRGRRPCEWHGQRDLLDLVRGTARRRCRQPNATGEGAHDGSGLHGRGPLSAGRPRRSGGGRLHGRGPRCSGHVGVGAHAPAAARTALGTRRHLPSVERAQETGDDASRRPLTHCRYDKRLG